MAAAHDLLLRRRDLGAVGVVQMGVGMGAVAGGAGMKMTLQQLEDRLRAAEDALDELEWSGRNEMYDDDRPVCPLCGTDQGCSHVGACKIGAWQRLRARGPR